MDYSGIINKVMGKIDFQYLKTGSNNLDCCQTCVHFARLSGKTGICKLIQGEITKQYNIFPSHTENGELCIKPIVYIGNYCDKFTKS